MARQISSFFVFTSQCSHESLNVTAHRSQGEIAHHGAIKADCESKRDHDQSSHSQVDQDEVEGLPELLVLGCDQQCQKVDREAGADQEEHVEGQQFEHPWIRQVILCVIKRIPYKPCSVVHRNIEVLALCAVLHLCKLGSDWQSRISLEHCQCSQESAL